MTVQSEVSRVSYSGDGSTTVFSVNFYFLANADLRVVLRASDGTETVQTLGTDYTVSGAGNENGGSVTFTTAPASGTTVVIVRNPPVTQLTDYNDQDPFPAASHERALDKLTMIVQRNVERLARAILLKETSSLSDLEFPDPEAGKILGWNSGANGVENKTLVSTTTPFPTDANRYIRLNASGVPAVLTAQESSNLDELKAVNPGTTGLALLADELVQDARDTLGDLETKTDAEAYAPDAAPEYIRTAGYSFAGDGGGALYKKVAAEPSHAGKFSITLADAVTVVWYELAEAIANPLMLGAAADGTTTDDADDLNAAAEYALAEDAILDLLDRSYRADSTVNLRYVKLRGEYATITAYHSGIGVILGGDASGDSNPKQAIGTVLRDGGVTSTPDIQILGSKMQDIWIGRSEYVQLFANTNSDVNSTDYSIAYSKFTILRALTLELTNNPDTDGSLTQWINENRFDLHRIRDIVLSGTYNHNHNHFTGGTLENGASITVENGHSNTFDLVRGESNCDVTYAAGTWNNRVIQTWISSTSTLRSEIFDGTVSDSGVGNIAIKQAALDRRTCRLGRMTFRDPVLNNQVLYPNARASLGVVRGAGAASELFVTDRFRVNVGDVIGFRSQGSLSRGYRIRVTFFDASGAVITPTINTDFQSATMTFITGSPAYVTSTTDRTQSDLMIISTANIAYAQVSMRGPNTATNALGDTVEAYLRRVLKDIDAALRSDLGPITSMNRSGNHPVTAAPTQGFVPVGYTATKSDGADLYIATFSLDTTLANAASASATSIEVDDATGVADGDIVGILNDDEYVTDWTTVSGAPSGATITLAAGLTGDCAAGNRVVFMRWVSRTLT